MHHAAGWDASILATAWSEYNGSYGSKGLTAVIMKLAEMLIGQDPRPVLRCSRQTQPILDGIGR
jgi:hypothetical protein